MAGTCQFLSLDDIIETNRQMLEAFGGLPFSEADGNFVNEAALSNVLYRAEGPIFGFDRYPTVVSKAAAIAWCIIKSHVFRDGNKRTGLEVCELFLQINGCDFTFHGDDHVSDSEAVDTALIVASGDMDEEKFMDWFRGRLLDAGMTEEGVDELSQVAFNAAVENESYGEE